MKTRDKLVMVALFALFFALPIIGAEEMGVDDTSGFGGALLMIGSGAICFGLFRAYEKHMREREEREYEREKLMRDRQEG